MEPESLHDLYVSELRDLYNAENQLVKALPKMAKAASSPELRQAFEGHLKQTKGHVHRIEQIMKKLGKSPKGKRCIGMEGLIAEGKELMTDGAVPEILDAGLIVAGQKVEHYEMAAYGSVRTYAGILGDNVAHRMLQQTLNEEAEADRKLTQLAEHLINLEAAEVNVEEEAVPLA
ncbi:MAG: ferritin-like domain-containing protein [Armatimonadota bacterium]